MNKTKYVKYDALHACTFILHGGLAVAAMFLHIVPMKFVILIEWNVAILNSKDN